MKHHALPFAIPSILCLALLGCDDKNVGEPEIPVIEKPVNADESADGGTPDVGPTDSGLSPGDAAEPAEPAACPFDAVSGPSTFEFDGYMTRFDPKYGLEILASDSERVRVTLERDAANQWKGVLRFGDATIAEAGNDVDHCPPHLQGAASETFLIGGLVSGVEYELDALRVDCQRLRFSMHPSEPWGSWCELQKPIKDENNEGWYTCVPNVASSGGGGICTLYFEDGTEQVVDCCKQAACTQVCECTETKCGIPDKASGVPFDFDVDGDEMQAFFPVFETPPTEVRLRAVR